MKNQIEDSCGLNKGISSKNPKMLLNMIETSKQPQSEKAKTSIITNVSLDLEANNIHI